MKKTIKNLIIGTISIFIINTASAEGNRNGLDKILDTIESQQTLNKDQSDKVNNAKEEAKIAVGKDESLGDVKVSPITTPIAAELKLIAQNGTGFMTGKINAGESPIMVLFDPQCPYCKSLWNASRSGSNQDIPVIWIPVSLLNDKSYGQSAAILSSEHPVDIMNKHIAMFENNHYGIEPVDKKNIPDELQTALDRNILLYSKMGFQDFPIILKITRKGNLLIKKGDTSIKGLKAINDI